MIEFGVAATLGIVAAAGLYLSTSRDMVSIVLGLALLGSAANLFVLAAGRLGQIQPPIVPVGALAPAEAVADPLPQALVLTAIVIGFALACFGLALALALQSTSDVNDADQMDAAESPPRASGEPGNLP